MKKIVLSFGIIVLIVSVLQGQNKIRSFKDFKIVNNQKEVTFFIDGVINKQQRYDIQESLEKNVNIYYAMIYPDNKCHLKMNPSLDADYIYNLINPYNVDFNYLMVDKKINEQVIKNTSTLPNDFPKREYTGNDKQDEEILAKKVKEWKKNHPEEWQQILNNRNK